jgi:hypothetical protein
MLAFFEGRRGWEGLSRLALGLSIFLILAPAALAVANLPPVPDP